MIKKRAYAKINLSLDVIGKLENGYHEVCMVMQTVGLFDELSFDITDVNDRIPDRIQINIESEKEITSDNKDNLVYKAASLLLPYLPEEKGVRITLKKNIPMAAGMAGGSTDAAATFRGINELFDLKLSDEELCDMGVKIGADVPYCIMGGTMVAEGIGEKLTELSRIKGINLVIAKPEAGVSTKYVYEHLDALENPPHPDTQALIAAINEKKEGITAEEISEHLGNILEEVTIPACPEIQRIKDSLMKYGALGSLMSGSGPTVFAIFENEDKAKEAAERLKSEPSCPAKDIFVTTTI